MSAPALSEATFAIRRAGKVLDRTVWRFRSYFMPSHIWTYWSLVRKQRASPVNHNGGRFVYLDFSRVDIDNVGGRYLFALVRDFEALGLHTVYQNNFRFLATMRHKEHKRLLLERPYRICESPDELPEGSVVGEVTDREQGSNNSKRRQIRILYEPRWPQADWEVPMTFFVYPLLYDQWLAYPPPDLTAPRSWRVFFSGRLEAKYSASTLPDKFGKMSRPQILQALEANLPADRLRHIASANDLAPTTGQRPRFVWADPARYEVPQSEWLDVLARADFFLACPGVEMPLCHNLVEALSRGAVPILEHPEFLDPPLEHNVNCLVFRGREELLKTMEDAFQRSPEEINRLRQGAYAYHQKHLAPGAFAKRLLNQPHPRVDVLLNAYRVPRPRQ